jgi:hypothetical protein
MDQKYYTLRFNGNMFGREDFRLTGQSPKILLVMIDTTKGNRSCESISSSW